MRSILSCHYFFHMSKAVIALVRVNAERYGYGKDSEEVDVMHADEATLRQMSEVLYFAKGLVDWQLEEREKERKLKPLKEAFNAALEAGDLKKMQRAHRKLGSPDLADFDVRGHMSAMEVFLRCFDEDSDLELDLYDFRAHLAWLQGVGARLRNGDWCHDVEVLPRLISQGLDLTGIDLMDVEGADGSVSDWLTDSLFTSTKKGDKDYILSFLTSGAGMWPLDLPGASVDEPPAAAYTPRPDPDGEWVSGGGWEERDYRTLFWPKQFPRHADVVDKYPPVEEIRESVTAVCSFFADKREKERRERCEAAWQRRRLVVLCANRVEGGPKRHKTAELTGLGALVRGVTAQQLWRTVVGYL
jgi:hypothetical protein